MAEIYRNRLKWESEDGNTYIFDKNIGASVVGQVVYSTDEIVVGKWIDGKPIYRKAIKFNNTTEIQFAAGTWYNTGFTLANVDQFMHGWVAQSGMDANYPVSPAMADNTIIIMGYRSTNYIKRDGRSVLILEYTKTTDAPGSYKPTSTELTEEHLTGETFNGKPVYEKVVTGTAGATSSGGSIDVSDIPIDVVLSIDGTVFYSDANGKQYMKLGMGISTSNLSSVYYASGKIIPRVTSSAYFNKPVWVTLKYTKTTD